MYLSPVVFWSADGIFVVSESLSFDSSSFVSELYSFDIYAMFVKYVFVTVDGSCVTSHSSFNVSDDSFSPPSYAVNTFLLTFVQVILFVASSYI